MKSSLYLVLAVFCLLALLDTAAAKKKPSKGKGKGKPSKGKGKPSGGNSGQPTEEPVPMVETCKNE